MVDHTRTGGDPFGSPTDGTHGHAGRARRSALRFLGLLTGGLVLVAATSVGFGVMLLSATDGMDDAGSGPVDRSTSSTVAEIRRTGDGAPFSVWDINDDGTPVRWDPCTPIELVVSDTAGPAGLRDDLDRAVSMLRDASGLDLRVRGDVDETPTAHRSPYQPGRYGERWAPVLVAWAQPGHGDLPMRSTDRGLGIPVAVGGSHHRTHVSGQVVLNADRTDLRPGFGDRSDSWGATLLHELMHVLGLDHVDETSELMAVHPGNGPVVFGEGDLEGLQAIGATHGCLDVPAPRAVDVRIRGG